MVQDMPTPQQALFDTLQNEAMAQAMTPKGMQRATEATQSLVLDLALSRHVYAPQGFSETGINVSKGLDGADMLSQATQALTLGVAEPPPLQFGFLRPMAKMPYEDDEQMGNLSSDGELEIPLGVHLLLSQWDVGSSPKEYRYKDHYVAQDTPLTHQVAVANKKGSQSTRQSMQQTSIPAVVTARPQPPMVISSMSRPDLIKDLRPPVQTASSLEIHAGTFPARQRPRLFTDDDNSLGGTQPTRLVPNSFSQDLPEMSTQPLPGPFGGNRARKTMKKRLGGF
jgi:hypothetical protein